MRGAEFRYGKRESGHQLLLGVQQFLRNRYFEQPSVDGNFALVLILIAMRGEQEGTINRAIDGYLAFCAAADGTDFFAFGRTETVGFAFSADRTEHGKQNTRQREKSNICSGEDLRRKITWRRIARGVFAESWPDVFT